MKKTFNRRAFLQRLGAAALGIVVAEPVIELAKTVFVAPPGGWAPGLTFRLEDQFSVGGFDYDGEFAHLGDRIGDRISMRYIKQYDISPGQPSRLDVLYGVGTIPPDLTARIVG